MPPCPAPELLPAAAPSARARPPKPTSSPAPPDLGLRVSRPWGDSAPYDLIVEGRRRLHRVQIKSVWTPRPHRRRSYRVSSGRGHRNKRPYLPGQIDFLAVLIHCESVWYIIPVRALNRRRTLRLGSDHPQSHRLFERYRDAWRLFV